MQLIGGCPTGKNSYNVPFDCLFACRASGGDSCGVDSDNSSDSDPYDLSTNQRIGIYGGIVFSSIFLVMTRSVLSFLICIASARNLHNKMLMAILRAPVLFFDTNPIGRFCTVVHIYSVSCGKKYKRL